MLKKCKILRPLILAIRQGKQINLKLKNDVFMTDHAVAGLPLRLITMHTNKFFHSQWILCRKIKTVKQAIGNMTPTKIYISDCTIKT